MLSHGASTFPSRYSLTASARGAFRGSFSPFRYYRFLPHPPDSIPAGAGYGGLDVQPTAAMTVIGIDRREFGVAPPYSNSNFSRPFYVFFEERGDRKYSSAFIPPSGRELPAAKVKLGVKNHARTWENGGVFDLIGPRIESVSTGLNDFTPPALPPTSSTPSSGTSRSRPR